MFLIGLLLTSVLVHHICLEHTTFTPLISAAIAVGCGLLFGLLTLLVQYVGLFVMGLSLGASLAIVILVVLHIVFAHLQIVWIPIGVTAGLGLLFAFVTLKFPKGGTILGTSLVGGLLMISCIDYFIEQFVLMEYIRERFEAAPSLPLCWYSWIILGCWPFCFLVGTVAQWKITGQGFDHKQGEARCLFWFDTFGLY